MTRSTDFAALDGRCIRAAQNAQGNRIMTEQKGSPFHQGEQAIQTRIGIRDKMDAVGRRMLLPHLLAEHQAFFQQLPMVFIATIDAHGHPLVSLRWGEPGFLSSPDPGRLIVRGDMPNADPVRSHLEVGAPVGLLGLTFESRRRNRLNGTVEAVRGDGGFSLRVEQSFGNCPKYIQRRRWQWRVAPPEPHNDRNHTAHESDCLSAQLVELLGATDTFLIATSAAGKAGTRSSAHQAAAFGVDVSHRGGAPGFVQVLDERTFDFPDYSGNMLFNTLGNLVVDDRAALLFPVFESGDLIQCQGRVEVLWDRDERTRFPGARRVLRFHLDRVRHAIEAMPFCWSPAEPSPFNP